MSLRSKISSLFLLFSIAAFPISCGGGGGGGTRGSSSDPAAIVKLGLTRKRIDSGERTTVAVSISRVNELGVVIKIRFPKGLAYSSSTSVLDVDGDLLDVGPTDIVKSGDEKYLTFFLDSDYFVSGDSGTLTFDLEGTGAIEDGQIEVDADINDPDVSDSKEFNSSNPNFTAQDNVSITVVDDV